MRQKIQIIFVVVMAVALAIVSFTGGFLFHNFNTWDSCLDGGGAWDDVRQLCWKNPLKGGGEND